MEPLFPKEKFKGTLGHLFTQGLFYEYRYQHGFEWTPYTLREDDWQGCLSMRKIYLQQGSEYEAAQLLLGSWDHWNRLKRCSWFKDLAVQWEEERKIREASDAKRLLMEHAEEGSIQAAKAIFDNVAPKRGRPSTQEKAQLVREDKDLDDFLTKSLHKIVPINKGKK